MFPLFPPNDDMIAFLRACKERPDDDAPRLVFADYLEENGYPERAELIRVQCGSSAVIEPPIEQARNWFAPWWDVLRPDGYGWHRGLLKIAVSGEAFVDSFWYSGDASPWNFMWVEQLEISNDRCSDLAFDNLAVIPELTDLSLTVVRENATAYLRSPAAQHLRSLRITEDWITSPATNRVATIASLPKLRSLCIRRITLSNEECDHFTAPLNFPKLQRLDLGNCSVTYEAYARLKTRFGAGLTIDHENLEWILHRQANFEAAYIDRFG